MDEKKQVSEDRVSQITKEDLPEGSISNTESTSGKFWVVTLAVVISLTRIGHVYTITVKFV